MQRMEKYKFEQLNKITRYCRMELQDQAQIKMDKLVHQVHLLKGRQVQAKILYLQTLNLLLLKQELNIVITYLNLYH